MEVRTRYAPSPTGPLHMGGVRTALFSYLFAKKNNGVFVLRIEDTDKERSEKKWEKDILDTLSWLGIDWQEGPDGIGDKGPHAPYRQSERTSLYKEYLEKLLEKDKAYWCFCTEEELEKTKQEQMAKGEAPKYLGTCRNLPFTEQEERLENKVPAVIRFKIEPQTVVFTDLIRGEISFDMALSGDIVIAKNIETPLYNFTVVIDDYKMQITHVIRGEDHIANTPKQILLWQTLGFGKIPEYAHVPLLLAEDHTKLSKRHGDNSVSRFKEEGYLPQAIINFLSLLGWNPGDEREIFSLEELTKEFSLEKVQKSGAIFQVSKLDWINGHYIRFMSPQELAEAVQPFLPTNHDLPAQKIAQIIELEKERIKKLSDIKELSNFFFGDIAYNTDLLNWKKTTPAEIKQNLKTACNILENIGEDEWTKENLEKVLMPEAEKTDRGAMLWPMRVALTGKKGSPGPFEVAFVLGKKTSIQRVKEAIEKLT